ncbi:MAG: hypothetical protein QNK37_04850 [Acidobacteriota bacterium]|nr:hypothetical protein [Acidobacteriota bacterium]
MSAGDSYGNYTPHLPATSGDAFHVYADPSGNRLKYKGPAQSCQEIELANDLKRGAISANVFKDDRLFAHQSAIAPGQKAVFVFKPMLVVAVVNNVVKEGNQMVSAVMSQKTELSLLGVRSADIVLTGGGADNKATPFKFQLENVVWV